MKRNRDKLYLILIIACMTGFIWIYLSMSGTYKGTDTQVEVCLIRHTTNIPCPSCGATRSVISLINGNISESLYVNPFGLVIFFIMTVSPIWIMFDILTKRKTFFDFYNLAELHLKKPVIAIPLILLVVANWVWNITKGL